MVVDEEKIDEATLGLLYLTLHDDMRAWKGFDFEAMNRLHKKGFIADPVNKNKSVILTEKGIAESKRLFELSLCKEEVAPPIEPAAHTENPSAIAPLKPPQMRRSGIVVLPIQ